LPPLVASQEAKRSPYPGGFQINDSSYGRVNEEDGWEPRRRQALPLMANKLLQANLNHARAAQDLILQYAAECNFGTTIKSEPYRVPPGNPHWAAVRCGGRHHLTAIRKPAPLHIPGGERLCSHQVGRHGRGRGVSIPEPEPRRSAKYVGTIGGVRAEIRTHPNHSRGLQCLIWTMEFPAHQREGCGSGGLGGVTAPVLERGHREHLREAAGRGVHHRYYVGDSQCCGQNHGLEGEYGNIPQFGPGGIRLATLILTTVPIDHRPD